MEGLTSAWQKRPIALRQIKWHDWNNWHWQQKVAVRNAKDLLRIFPTIDRKTIEKASNWNQLGFRFCLTPYILSLIEKDEKGNPVVNDPLWRQFFPQSAKLLQIDGKQPPDEYSPQSENWELDQEMITPICQHKYPDRVLVNTIDACSMYCIYCFRSLVSEAPEEKHGGLKLWQSTVKALSARPQVKEAILSGGDPLLLGNEQLEELFKDLRSIPTIERIRIHTRMLSHNPYRIDNQFCRLLSRYQITAVALHVVHPTEITPEFIARVRKLRQSGTLVLSQLPLLKGVNNEVTTLRKLFERLYGLGVSPHYLFHAMPNIPTARLQRTSVREGVLLMNELFGRVTGPAIPRFVISHRTGKKVVPLNPRGDSQFIYTVNEKGWPIVRFLDWRGTWQEYLDR